MTEPAFTNPKAHRQRRRTAWAGTIDHKRYLNEEGTRWDYIEHPPRFSDEHEHTLITSLAEEPVNQFDRMLLGLKEGEVMHYPVIDIDAPVRIVPSSTPGHFHLFLDLPIGQDAYFKFLEAAAGINLVEPGYVEAAKAQGCTAVWKQEY